LRAAIAVTWAAAVFRTAGVGDGSGAGYSVVGWATAGFEGRIISQTIAAEIATVTIQSATINRRERAPTVGWDSVEAAANGVASETGPVASASILIANCVCSAIWIERGANSDFAHTGDAVFATAAASGSGARQRSIWGTGFGFDSGSGMPLMLVTPVAGSAAALAAAGVRLGPWLARAARLSGERLGGRTEVARADDGAVLGRPSGA
jgi:hypothetical protein